MTVTFNFFTSPLHCGRNLEKAESRMDKLQRGLDEVDRKVDTYKRKFENTTTEAAKLRLDLEKAEETIKAAELLVGKLDVEYERWNSQVRQRCHYRRGAEA